MKTIAQQLADLGLVKSTKAAFYDEVSVMRLRRECYRRAVSALDRIESDHREVKVEYRRAREAGGKVKS